MNLWLTRLSYTWLAIALGIGIGWGTKWIPYWEAGTYAGVVLLGSLAAFLSQGMDKWAAKNSLSRIPEKSLHMLELIGGWPGAHLGQQLFRHKTQKPSYRSLFLTIVAVHILVVIGCWCYFGIPGSE